MKNSITLKEIDIAVKDPEYLKHQKIEILLLLVNLKTIKLK